MIKAAGGVRILDDLLRVRALRASRIGAIATMAILQEAARASRTGPIPRGLGTPAPAAPATIPAGY